MTPPVNPSSSWDAQKYATTGSFVPALAEGILESLAVQPGERILDVGCGDGALTQRLVAAGAAVVGIDASPELTEVARGRGLEVILGDATAVTFDSEFDAVFSNAALHWILDQRAVTTRMLAALRPGGRLAVEFGGFGNVAAIRTALRAVLERRGITPPPSDFFHPTAEQYRDLLTSVGFTNAEATIVPRPTVLADGMAPWLRTFRSGMLDALGLGAAEQAAVVEQTVELLTPVLRTDDGTWYADRIRIRAWATRPEE